MNELPHLDDHGRSRMIDIGGKAITRRTAIATGRLDTTPAVLELLATLGVALVAVSVGLRLVYGHIELSAALTALSLTVDVRLTRFRREAE